jgi:small GTP-binding protein
MTPTPTSSPTSTPTITPLPSATKTALPTPFLGVILGNVWVHTGPSPDSARSGLLLSPGEQVELLALDGDWAQVRPSGDGESRTAGWIPVRWLGATTSIPICSIKTMPTSVINKKVCLLGDFAVGKTSLVRRFVYERFEDKYLSTIGVKVSRKVMVVNHQDRLVDLAIILWDLAGSEEFDQLRGSYLRGAAGVVLVCDLTRPETFHHLPSYWNDLRRVCPTAQVILAANKIDLTDDLRIPSSEIDAYAASLKIPHYQTSAKSGNQVETLFRQLGQLMLTHQF